jgi:hypothetical protein
VNLYKEKKNYFLFARKKNQKEKSDNSEKKLYFSK